MSYLESIPLEILTEIFQHCDVATLAAIGCTCRSLCNQSLPVLYHDVDLGWVNSEFVPGRNVGQRECAWRSRRALPEELLHRQIGFIRSLKSRPEYGRFVRRFRWTLLWPDWNIKEAPRYEDYKLVWEVFSFLTAVQELDLMSYHHNTKKYVRDSPLQLFPSANNIRIAGPMHRGLATAVFTNPEKIKSLVLYNLQDEGTDLRGHPMVNSPDTEAYKLGPGANHRCNEGDTRDGYNFWVLAGPMRGLIPSIASRLLSLKYLYIGRPGESERDQIYYRQLQEEESYREYATLIGFVCKSLEHFEFEQSGYLTAAPARTCVRSGRQLMRPMDERFKSILLPSLLSGPWPRLKSMKLVGVGHWEEFPPILSEEDISILQKALGKAKLEIIEKGVNVFWPFLAYEGRDRWEAQ